MKYRPNKHHYLQNSRLKVMWNKNLRTYDIFCMKELTSARDAELKVRIKERRMDVTNKSQSSYPKLRGYHYTRWKGFSNIELESMALIIIVGITFIFTKYNRLYCFVRLTPLMYIILIIIELERSQNQSVLFWIVLR